MNSFKVLLIQFVVPPVLLVVSLLLRPIAGKSSRLRAAWAFLSLWLAPFFVSFLPATWSPGIEPMRTIAHALLELAAIQLAAVVVFNIILRRFALKRLVPEAVVGAASAVVLINLLYGLGVNATGMFATCAITIAIMAFAVRDLLSSVAGGILLDLTNGLKVGDYIQCGEWSGWVESISLRQTTIKDFGGDVIVLPNSQLYRTPVRICAPLHRQIIPFVMAHGIDSQEVIETVEFALCASPIAGIAADPPPSCTIQEMTMSAVTYSIAVWVDGPGDHTAEVSTVLTRIGFALERAGLPYGDFVNVIEVIQDQNPSKQSVSPIELLRRAPILRLLDEEDLVQLASSLHRFSFGPGEFVVRQGEDGDSMYFIGKGKVSILFNSGDGVERQVALMAKGDFFGEASLLTGEARTASAQAVSRVDCYRLNKEGLQDFIHRRADLVEDIASVMTGRQMELNKLRVKLDSETAEAREAEAHQQFRSSIQRFFGWATDRPMDTGQGQLDSLAVLPGVDFSPPHSSKPEERPQTQSVLDRHTVQLTKASNPVRAESGNPAGLQGDQSVRLNSVPVAAAARERAARLLKDRKYSEALQALAEADAIEKDPALSSVKRETRATRTVANPRRAGTVDQAMKIVNRYSKIAAGAGLVPGALINFVAILAIQVRMVWKLARCFGYKEPVERVRGSIMSLLASGIPAALGHGAALAVTTTAIIGGSVLYFLFTPVLAYAVTQAVGRTFVMHFESGGTLLTFDATAFQDYFLSEFHQAREKRAVKKPVAA
ncbi:MAG TPA: cyclic nucleotide-binding domain-containing protein [Bryobacteraceae bacterium]|jgi:CRP-like cAMP-binding protein/uncharacterized protein (DUF697 family)|nr:cyclic nucleotide-binding domain-containing protein [Bryobacteraceae bacterium]